MKRVTYWMVSTEEGYPDAAVRISMQSSASEFDTHVPVLNAVLNSFTWNLKIPK